MDRQSWLHWQVTCEAFCTPEEWGWWFKQTGYTGDYSFIYFDQHPMLNQHLPHAANAAERYEQDFNAWLLENAHLIREHQWQSIDVDHLADELEAMAKTEKRELLSRLSILLMHLLKWQYQAPKRTRSWSNTIAAQRMDIQDLLDDSPSLRPYLAEKLASAYIKAKLKAENKTGIDQQHFPQDCPYLVEQILAADFLPE